MPSSPAKSPHEDSALRQYLLPLAGLMRGDVTEIVVNRPGVVWTEGSEGWARHEIASLTFDHCMQLAKLIANYNRQAINEAHPILSAVLPDGSRAQVMLPPATEQGVVSMTIRRPMSSIKPLDQYAQEGAFKRYLWGRPRTLDARRKDLSKVDRELVDHLSDFRLLEFLQGAVRARKNIAVVGDTGSGKTTLMKSMCQVIPAAERLITIEDVRELYLPQHDNRVHLLYAAGGQGQAKITPAQLIASCMRMKPDRVLLAELRGAEAFDFLKLLTTGHAGSITSFHAESCALAAERYVFMAKEHVNAAIYDDVALKRLVSMTIDVVLHVVAEEKFDANGEFCGKDRYVAEVHFDPIAKLVARFGDAELVRAGE